MSGNRDKGPVATNGVTGGWRKGQRHGLSPHGGGVLCSFVQLGGGVDTHRRWPPGDPHHGREVGDMEVAIPRAGGLADL